MEQKPISTLTERLTSLKLSSTAWLAGFAARAERITGEAGFWLWVYLIGVVFAAIGIYAAFARIF